MIKKLFCGLLLLVVLLLQPFDGELCGGLGTFARLSNRLELHQQLFKVVQVNAVRTVAQRIFWIVVNLQAQQQQQQQ